MRELFSLQIVHHRANEHFRQFGWVTDWIRFFRYKAVHTTTGVTVRIMVVTQE